MSTVLEIEEAVAKLPEPEFQTFAAWFDQTRASRVDDAFESTVLGDQFDEMSLCQEQNSPTKVCEPLN